MAGIDSKEVKKDAEEATKSVIDFKKELEDLGKVQFGDFLSKTSNILRNFRKDMKDAEVNAGSLRTSFDDLASGLNKTMMVLSSFRPFENFAVQGGTAISTMSDQFKSLSEKVGGISNLAKKLGGTFATSLAEGGERAVIQLLSHISSAEKLEAGYVSLMGATGKLGDLQRQMGGDFSKLGDHVANFSSKLAETGKITGYTTTETLEWAKSAAHVPGVFDQMVKSGEGSINQMNAFSAALLLARGSGRNASEVITVMATAYENLGNTQGKVTDASQKGAQMFALMSHAAQQLNLRFEDVSGYLTKVSNTFKYVGDNTQSATNLMGRFSEALQSTGLTAKASMDIVNHMVESIGNLQMGTKALISMRTGGPGGLQGAFQVENLLRQGKVDEVAKMMERTLRQQFGGKIHTLEEAAASPQAASQFQRQRAMIQSGAFGGLVKDEQQATRLLEALAKGPGETASIIKDGQSAIKETLSRGEDLRDKSNTLLNDINSTLEQIYTIEEQNLMLNARRLIGTERDPMQGSSQYAENLLKSIDQAKERQFKSTVSGEPKSFEQQNLEANRVAFGGYGRVLSAVPELGKRSMSMTAEHLKGVAKRAEGLLVTKQSEMVPDEQTSMRNIVAQRMQQQRPTTLGASIPKQSEMMKHEVTVKQQPLEVKIHVSRDPGLDVNTTTSGHKNVSISRAAASAQKGWVNE